MDVSKIIFLVINVLGGIAVLGSYAVGLMQHPGRGLELWGGVPKLVQKINLITMPLAAIGYLLFAYFILFHLDAKKLIFANSYGFDLINIIFIGILLPSAIWMPLTFLWLDKPNPLTWWGVRIVLFVVGLASLVLLAALLSSNIREPAWSYWLAVAGAAAFFVQTGIMDAFVWAAWFPQK